MKKDDLQISRTRRTHKTDKTRKKKKDITEDYVVFATNVQRYKILEEIDMIPQEYRKRWGVETAFRCIEDILGKTASRNMAVRTLLFFMAVVVFNLWVMRCYVMHGAGNHIKLAIFALNILMLCTDSTVFPYKDLP